jgi:hypothetical protein
MGMGRRSIEGAALESIIVGRHGAQGFSFVSLIRKSAVLMSRPTSSATTGAHAAERLKGTGSEGVTSSS